jgi:hypothetical protein
MRHLDTYTVAASGIHVLNGLLGWLFAGQSSGI